MAPLIRATIALSVTALICAGCGSATHTASNPQTATPTATVQTFPPDSIASLHAIATQTEPKVLSSEDVSVPGCRKARVSVLIPPGTSDQAEVGMLAAAYFDEQVDGGVVFGYRSAADANMPPGYTAGRIIIDDPCQPDATVEVDTGGVTDAVSYTFPLGP